MNLRRRISIILLVVVFFSGTLIAILATESSSNAFDEYISESYQVMLEEWGQIFASYYVRNDYQWQGVERLFVVELQSGVILSDLSGQILYHYDRSYIGEHIPMHLYRRGYPLYLDAFCSY